MASGIRALQAAMLTFSRIPPNTIGRVLGRRAEKTPADVRRSYLAALLLGVARTGIIGDWKIARMVEARSWFLGVILGALGVTASVLFGAVF
ncbi:MAG: hypothetical protein AB7V58_11115 [Solirubrobacterales bacterium]